MTPEQWARLDRIWQDVVARPDAERASAIGELCGADEDLRREVESLLANLANASAAGFGATPGSVLPVKLAAGTRLGPYEIVASIGAGGMGEVYRARDTRLGRDVAVKVLPFDAAGDPDRLRRFSEEARAAAALNHPNILAVYDVGSQAIAHPARANAATAASTETIDIAFIVTELLEGRTLRRVIGDEVISPTRAIGIGSQVADGLAAAHGRGIVHRDLKPENLFVTADGHAKILDFGLAKALADTKTPGETATRTGTAPHMVLGTPGYMAPEQLRGQPVDHRADIFAFGAVLYEMLTGTRAFGGSTPMDAMGAVLRDTPSGALSTPDRAYPAALVRIVERCLEKLPASRFQSTTDLAFALKSLATAPVLSATAIPSTPARSLMKRTLRAAPWGATAVLAGTLAVFAPWQNRQAASSPQTAMFQIPETDAMPFAGGMGTPSPAISPDGSKLVFTVRDPAGFPAQPGKLWVRPINSLDAHPLDRTEINAPQALPFWSPDSASIGFYQPNGGAGEGGKLRAIDLASGVVRTICELKGALLGGTWNKDGTVLFASVGTGELLRVPAAGGTPSPVSALDGGEQQHRFPWFLPDGRHYVFQTSPDRMLAIGSLDDKKHTHLVKSDSRAVYAPPGYLLYLKSGALVAQAFDASSRTLRGDPTQLVDSVNRHQQTGRAAFTVSETGTLIYNRTGTTGSIFVWVNRADGTVVPTQTTPEYWVGQELFPDDRHVLSQLHDENDTGNVWVLDLDRAEMKRGVTAGPHDLFFRLSPDGSQFVWLRAGNDHSVFRRRSDGTNDEEKIEIPQLKITAIDDYSKNWIVMEAEDRGGQKGIWIADAADLKTVQPFLKSPAGESNGRVSPDERWLAYYSARASSKPSVHIRPFPSGQGEWVVPGSENSGLVRWRGDSKELFFAGADRQKVSVVTVAVSGGAIQFGTPQIINTPLINFKRGYEVSDDGQRILFASEPTPTASEAQPRGALTAVVNWTRWMTGR